MATTSLTDGVLNCNQINASQLIGVFPVGSIYQSTKNVSPASFLGGTWKQLENRFLLGAGSSYTNGATGGESSHTLSVSEMPSHNHGSAGSHTHTRGSMEITGSVYSHARGANFSDIETSDCSASGALSPIYGNQTYIENGGSLYAVNGISLTASNGWSGSTSSDGAHEHTWNGGSTAHNNMPPYLVVYMWERTA